MSRILPSNIEAEQALLGAIMVRNDAWQRVSAFLEPKHFFEPLHQKIYAVISDFIRLNKAANPVTLKNFLPSNETVGDMTLQQYMARLAAEAVTVLNAYDYAMSIHDLWQRRAIITIGENMVNTAWDAPIDFSPLTIASELSEQVANLIAEGNQDDDDCSAIAVADGLMLSSPNIGRPLSWPLIQVKEVMQDDARSGKYYGILSSSGEGKTSFVLQCLHHFASQDSPVFFISYDQSAQDCVVQMATQHIGIEGSRIRDKALQQREYERYFDFLSSYKKLPIEIKQVSRFGLKDIRLAVTKFVKKYAKKYSGPAVIIIDHMKKIPLDGQSRDPGTEAAIKNNFMKSLAIEFDAVTIGLMQRNSEGKKRQNPRPIDSDMYGGEASREDFDSVFYVYRPDKYKEMQLRVASNAKETDEINNRFKGWDGLAEFGALKVRFGNPNQRRRVKFEAEYTRYVSMREEEPMLLDGL